MTALFSISIPAFMLSAAKERQPRFNYAKKLYPCAVWSEGVF